MHGPRHKKQRYTPKKSFGSVGECHSEERALGRAEVVSISHLLDAKVQHSDGSDNVITIHTGLRRWWRDENWRTWLILSLCLGAILGLMIERWRAR